MLVENSQKEHLKKCIARARKHLHDVECEVPATRQPDSIYLFEGHLTVQPEPAPPAWLVTHNLLKTLVVAQNWASVPESSKSQEESRNSSDNARRADFPEAVQELINSMQGIGDFLDLDNVIEASIHEIGAGPQRSPPASKEVVANLSVITVAEEVITRLGSETECAVCCENLVINDKIQELPCKHLFHPPCLKPWLDKNNSCLICRHELRTDNHEYESLKERESEVEEERKGAANALRGREYMNVYKGKGCKEEKAA